MGAPPGVQDAPSASLTTPLPKSSESSPPSGSDKSSPPSGSSVPRDVPAQFQQPNAADPLKLMGLDEKRQRLAKGLRLYSDSHLDSAKHELQPIREDPLAKDLLVQIRSHESVFHARQLAFVLKALVQDAFQKGDYSEAERLALYRAVDQIEAQLLSAGSTDLNQAIRAAQPTFDAESAAVWTRFAAARQAALAELAETFLETDAALLAQGVLGMADRYRERKSYGTAWALAQLAAEHPTTEKRAKEISDYLDGKRTSTEYILSDMFDHGGTAMAIDLLALAPTIALTRRLSTAGWLLRQRRLVRVPLTMLAGGAIHYGSTKVLQGLTGYTGHILPRSFKEFAGDFTSSTLQASLALLLANRKFMWGKPMATKEALAVVEAEEATAAAVKPAATWGRRLAWGGGKALRGAWWTTKTSLRVGLLSATNLGLVQWPLHHFGVADMTPQGLPSYAMILFPKTRDTRQAVAQDYAAHRLFRDYKKHGDGVKGVPTAIPGIDPGLDLDLLITQLDPGIEGGKREAAYAILAQAAASGKLGLNIRRWILQKKKVNELGGANKTFERQGIPLRYEQGNGLCIIDSEAFPCSELAADKP